MRRRAGRPRPERQVRLHISERGLPVERGLRAAEAAVATAQQKYRGTEKADHAHGKVSSGNRLYVSGIGHSAVYLAVPKNWNCKTVDKHGPREAPVEVVVERHDVRRLECEHQTVLQVRVRRQVERLPSVSASRL